MNTKWEQLRELKMKREQSQKRATTLIEIANGDTSTLTLARMNIITAIKCHQSLDEVRMNRPSIYKAPVLLDHDPMDEYYKGWY